MRIQLVLVFLLISVIAAILYEPAALSKQNYPSVASDSRPVPVAVQAAASGISVYISSIASPNKLTGSKPATAPGVRDDRFFSREKIIPEVPHRDSDGAPAGTSDLSMPAVSLGFDGLANYDNISLYNLLILPPDPIGDVGPSHYVQAVNSAVKIFDKSGIPLTSAFKISEIFAGLGTVCSMRNDGDPQVLYDALADRWLISQYCTAFPPFRQMIAVSRSGDPTGQYFVYEFPMPNVRLNDFPKMGVWPDGYYMSTEEYFGADYVGSGAFAFDRQKMLVGDPAASYIYFSLPYAYPERVGGFLPADLDGLRPPPAGTPNLFTGYTANEYGDAADAIRLFDFHADFAQPANSTFTEKPESPIAAAAFDPTSPGGRADIRQPLPGERLDANSDRLMYRAAYRNFGAFDSIVFNQTVRTSPAGEPYNAGVRLYELRRNAGSAFTISEQLTIGNNSASRWIGSAAQDNQGNLAVGYNYTSTGKVPSILYTGRLASEPPGSVRSEGTLVNGTGVQKAFGFRWGDYSGMSVDPADDCTFWMTGEYYTLESQNFSDFTWLTRIGRFKYPECTPAPRSVIHGRVTNAANGQVVVDAVVTANMYSRMSDANGDYGDLAVVPGTYLVRVSAAGYREQTVTVTAAAGQVFVRDFELQPIPVVSAAATTIVSESCSVNGGAEPGEMITMSVPLRNTGRVVAQSVSVRLLRAGGIVGPGPPQDYGTLPADGSLVSRNFSFTVSPGAGCGALLTMTFEVSAVGQPLEIVTVPLRAGALRFALNEDFDTLSRPALPAGWSSTSSGSQQNWISTAVRASSAPTSLFSPDPNQVGLNELVTPPISISSPDAKVIFRNWYELETTFLRNRLYDGSVLEISLDNGAWQDILVAGGVFESGGYDGTLDSCCQNPLAGRLAWSGRSGINQASEFITTAARLPSAAAGHAVRFRWRVATDVGTFREGQYVDDVRVTDGYACTCANAQMNRVLFDFDGDRRTDLSVFRPNDLGNAPDFIIRNSSNGAIRAISWGSVGDVAANADFDGDNRTDYVVFRPSNGTWYILRSTDLTFAAVSFGLSGDRPVPADNDGDGKADIAVFRPANGTWYWLTSGSGQFAARQFGLAGDRPVPGDYDGDGKSDVAVFRPSNSTWYMTRTSDSGFSIIPFGLDADLPVPGDYDGDGKTDAAVFRPSDGTWYLLRSKLGFGGVRFGLAGDAPLQADFDGDGMADIAVFRPATVAWYFIRSSDGTVETTNFGLPGDIAVPSIFTTN